MDYNIVRNILNDMIQSLDEFKSEDIVYYQRQVKRVLEYVERLENSSK
jgi:hypothetical protein